jgi:hypothetical protein
MRPDVPAGDCPDCHVRPGRYHEPGCDVERCPYCGGQLLTCLHDPPPDDREPWTGVWPGVQECRELGLWSRPVPGRGWVPCGPCDPGAGEDLNRLHRDYRWSRADKCFVRREKRGGRGRGPRPR